MIPAHHIKDPAPVDRRAFEARLEALEAVIPRNPAEGIFGPGSAVWQVNRESLLFFGAARATLLQLAHPWVAEAVATHSTTRTDPWGRFHRTFINVFGMVFGSREQAFARARAVRGIHERIFGRLSEKAGRFGAGSAYEANEAQALLWVHATLWDTSMRMSESILGPMEAGLKARYYEESKRFAALFGVPEEILPADGPAFAAYNEAMWASDTLAVSQKAKEVAHFVLREAPLRVMRGLPGWYLAMTAASLPPRLARDFGLSRDEATLAKAEKIRGRIALIYPRLPERLRYVPAYWEAQARLNGKTRPDALTRFLSRMWIGQPQL